MLDTVRNVKRYLLSAAAQLQHGRALKALPESRAVNTDKIGIRRVKRLLIAGLDAALPFFAALQAKSVLVYSGSQA